MSFSFLLGILACCVSAFVSANRFGFALEGAWCAVDRVYYDSLYGQLKTSEPKWEGFENITGISNNLSDFYNFIKDNSDDLLKTLLPNGWEQNPDKSGIWKLTAPPTPPTENQNLSLTRYAKIINSINQLSLVTNSTKRPTFDDSFTNIKSDFLDDHFYYYAKTLKACLKILAMIYYSFLLTAITAAGVSMMFYACLKRQGYLLTFMHVLWNVIRF